MKESVIKSLFDNYQPSMGLEPLFEMIEAQMKVFKPLLMERPEAQPRAETKGCGRRRFVEGPDN